MDRPLTPLPEGEQHCQQVGVVHTAVFVDIAAVRAAGNPLSSRNTSRLPVNPLMPDPTMKRPSGDIANAWNSTEPMGNRSAYTVFRSSIPRCGVQRNASETVPPVGWYCPTTISPLALTSHAILSVLLLIV